MREEGDSGDVENPEGSNNRDNNDNNFEKVNRLRVCASAHIPLGANTSTPFCDTIPILYIYKRTPDAFWTSLQTKLLAGW